MSNTPNPTPTPADGNVELDAKDQALLARISTSLQTDRTAIAASSDEFKKNLMKRISSGASVRRVGSGRSVRVIKPTSWTRHLKYYAAAVAIIGVALTLFAASGLLSPFSGDQVATTDYRAIRLTATRLPVAVDATEIATADLFKPLSAQKMVIVIDSPDGESCLTLIPQMEIDRTYDAAAKKALDKMPHWDVTVDAGKVALPAAAYGRVLSHTTAPLYLLKVGGHYEIWTAEALQRYTDHAVGQPQSPAPAVPGAPGAAGTPTEIIPLNS